MFNDIQVISKYQTFNAPSHPLISMDEAERDELFLKVTQEIKQVLSSNAVNEKKSFQNEQVLGTTTDEK